MPPEPEPDPAAAHGPEDPPVPAIVRRLQRRRAHHRANGMLVRVAWVLAGAVVTAAGLAMLVLPGPALVAIPAGLAILSLEFAWAARLLDVSLAHAHRAQRRAGSATRGERAMVVAAALVIAGACLVIALRYDVPVLPV